MLSKLQHWKQQWNALESWERSLLWRLCFRMAALQLALRIRGIGSVIHAIDQEGALSSIRIIPAGLAGPEFARRCEKLVLVAAFHGLSIATCLPRALLLYQLLSSFGLPARLKFGVQPERGTFEAHAWVECEGEAYGAQLARVFHEFPALGRVGAP